MCIGSKPKAPAVTPAPAPSPIPAPSESSPQGVDAERRSRLKKLRHGLMSTIKTSPRGLTGEGAELSGMSAGKAKLGA
jgi:hypothetical protein